MSGGWDVWEPTRVHDVQRIGYTRRRRLLRCPHRCVYPPYILTCRADGTPQERTKVAASLKAKGNSAYQARKFPTAIDYYTRAIAVTPTPEPVFFSNRAACFVNVNPPEHEKVVEDCDAALALDQKYLKALNRRATALEALERYEEALRGAFVRPYFQRQRLNACTQTSPPQPSLTASRTLPPRRRSTAFSKNSLQGRLLTFSR